MAKKPKARLPCPECAGTGNIPKPMGMDVCGYCQGTGIQLPRRPDYIPTKFG